MKLIRRSLLRAMVKSKFKMPIWNLEQGKNPLPAGSNGHPNGNLSYGSYQDNQLLSTQYINISFTDA